MGNLWKDYSLNYMKKNRSSSISVMVSVFIATFFLSLLCSLFFNVWVDEINRITLELGDWQGRVVGEISSEDLELLQNFPNVESAVVNQELSEELQGVQAVVDLRFEHVRRIFRDMPLILEELGLEENGFRDSRYCGFDSRSQCHCK